MKINVTPQGEAQIEKDPLDEVIRGTGAKRTLADQVEEIHRSLIIGGYPQYRALLSAVYDEQAVEGSLVMDDAMAAWTIREHAEDDSEIANEKLAAIAKALKVVLRRYSANRKERRKIIER